MKKMINKTHIEGYLYQHALVKKVAGPNSAHPGTEFITGTIDIATDNNMLNIVQVHFTYVTEKTSAGKDSSTYTTLNNIINGSMGSVMEHGADKAVKLRIDSAIGLNEFYVDRNGTEELVSAKRNEGGFIHTIALLEENEAKRNTFDCDMLITRVTHIDANEENNTPDRAQIFGYTFDYKNALLPVSFMVNDHQAMNYYENLEVSEKNPVFTRVQGVQISETIITKIEEESAFGGPSIREVKRNRKEFIVIWGRKEPYLWDDETTITVDELTKAMADRELYVATIKQRQDDYKATKAATTSVSVNAGINTDNFKF